MFIFFANHKNIYSVRRPRAVHGSAAPAGVRLRGRLRGEPLRQVHQGDHHCARLLIYHHHCFVADAVPRWHEVQEEVRRVTRTSDQLMGHGDCVSMAVMGLYLVTPEPESIHGYFPNLQTITAISH